ncbi:related to cellulose binding protein CEL1 [Rhynchosporium agropyri]|uniref:AA9 family lytic polysaccharide monooxygenase n=1 Tax=Rhynchosporium agropyri TaxID=914238 RepID=A0A1E1LQ78_9HELO|nr:related to cellulose binding protein CEL1 [Rhynchosporium agropyri]
MKSFTPVLAGLSFLASQASAHYIFNQITYGGTKYPIYQYIRQNTNMNSPVTDLTSTDLRCNQGGQTGGNTATLPVVAGGSFTFTTDTPVYHNGPLSIYMAKAPSTAASFDGSGQVWFKIQDVGPTFGAGGAVTWPLAQSYTYTIPKSLPNGEYLLRIQQIGIHNPWPGGIPQFYLSCAQISVTGGGSGTPGPLVSIPGFIKGDESGYTANIYSNFNSYTVPGPAVWSGGNSGGGGSPAPVTTSVAPAVTTSKPVAGTTTTAAAPVTTSTTTGPLAQRYAQCGGASWTGPTACVSPYTCKFSNSNYSQCL